MLNYYFLLQSPATSPGSRIIQSAPSSRHRSAVSHTASSLDDSVRRNLNASLRDAAANAGTGKAGYEGIGTGTVVFMF